MKPPTDRNYDNRRLTPDENLVFYFINKADLDSYINPNSIQRYLFGNVHVTGAWTAFRKGAEAEIAKKQFYTYTRDLNRQFHCKNALSVDWYNDTFYEEPVSDVLSPEQMIEFRDTSIRIVERLMDKAPQYLAAVVFHRQGFKGKDFDIAMRLGHSRAADLQKELSECLHDMVYFGYDQVELPKRKTKHDDYYKQVAYEHAQEIFDNILEMYSGF